jgi:lipid II:glycine glycyltransferase (peptidoglycan interpeptide bridge formation enzyme)
VAQSYGGFALAIHRKRRLETVMFRNVTGLFEMAVCCAKPPYVLRVDRAQLEAMQTAADRVAKSQQRQEEEKKRGRIINNKDYFAMMQAQYGEKAMNIGGSKMITKLKVRLAF